MLSNFLLKTLSMFFFEANNVFLVSKNFYSWITKRDFFKLVIIYYCNCIYIAEIGS
jgi:hypothetical protein